jgi:PPOX class probable F420-dependent enzyme
MELSTATEYARARRRGVLLTQRRDGHPQLSNIAYHLADDGVIRISITADRAKYKNLQREPWAALYLTQDDFWGYAVLEGEATVSPVATHPDDETADELVEYYRAVSGEHPDWDDYRRAMVADRRCVVRLTPTRAYGMVPD